MMMNYTVTVDIEKFEELIRISERVETIKRYKQENKYICTDDFLALLGIEDTYEDGEEA